MAISVEASSGLVSGIQEAALEPSRWPGGKLEARAKQKASEALSAPGMALHRPRLMKDRFGEHLGAEKQQPNQEPAAKSRSVDTLVLVVPRSHPLASERQVSFAQILDEQFVGLAKGALQDHINGHAAQAGRKLSFRARVRTFEGICTMVAQGAGIGIVPERAARRCRRTMPLASVRLQDAWATRRLSICYRPDEALPALTRDLLSHLREGYRQDRAA
ncbi:LysR substrate-binding domain-containing protein [Chelatococcus sp. GCM10030263]|uniref:LysR substrate-binding domain-containing protein n=1 Tax=Chelatococcus sp. GCM10030263 TaxID=3273387 RepID=UPI00361A8F16